MSDTKKMTGLSWARTEIAKEVTKYIAIMPGKRAEIIEAAELAMDEINSGESIDNEIYLMCSHLDEIHDEEAADNNTKNHQDPGARRYELELDRRAGEPVGKRSEGPVFTGDFDG